MSTTAPPPQVDEAPAAEGDARETEGRRGHVWLMRGIVTLASLLLVVGALAVWVDRLVQTDNWATTSARVLDNPTVQRTLSDYLVDQLYANVDVAAELRSALPDRAKPLAGPAAAGLRQYAGTAVQRALQRPRVQAAWVAANRRANEELRALLTGGRGALKTSGGTVALDLQPVLDRVQSRNGIGGRIVSALPAGSGRLVLLHSDQLKTAQTATEALRVVANWVVVLVVLLFAAAVWLAPDRRRAVRACAIGMLAAALVLIVVRRVLGDELISRLVSADSVRPAVHEVWWIATDQLRLITTTLVAVAIVGLVGAWIAGPGRRAVASRRWLAPYLREPGLAYGTLAGVILLLLAWAPLPAARNVVTATILIVLSVLGLEALRRQAAREFPDAERGSMELPSLRRGPEVPAVGVTAAAVVDSRIERLTRLAELHRAGVLSDEEFGREKQRILAPPVEGGFVAAEPARPA